ncbi:alanine--tRNA ligase [Mycoplasma sp. CSL10166]|uniref:alanine--tRNA ligase n=1 Tax=Mycoplasma sp. CSL10166 TaxID=2813825 RepID=UPI00197B93E7|nr:alanine--tRNA ligase [Mycoplasma sp. CSL10166]MBN4084237.1 alanine--tRNA ligase [Mycoplasma sp. CSL10166]
MNSKLIREKWLSFFESKGHFIQPSKSLVPQNDPSLLWVNSGVATLKDYFSGKKIPPSKRIANSQKSIRTNDIENVGITARHHTFFEMLGNFSIGDYFKKEAIEFAAEFLINELKLEKDKLYFTYYFEDLETKKIWIEQGFDESHMIPGDKDTNFWEVGSGPCGPNTEIFYDRGEKYDSRGIELLKEDLENDRYIEIWNIVFSTFNSDGNGNYTELKQKNIDTGAGLERIVSILQDAPTNFDTDLFLPIIHKIEEYTTQKYVIENYFDKDPIQTEINTNFKIIADHMRTVVNALADGAKPSNTGRGYILRRLIRRSSYKAISLGINDLFLYKLVKVVKETLPFEYETKRIEEIIKQEEITFLKTIDNGKKLLDKYIDENVKVFPGDVAFKLFETYGFPIELTTEILEQKNISIETESFEEAKLKHSEASKHSKVSGMDKVINSLTIIKSKVDKFIGYTNLESESNILYLLNTENEIDYSDQISYVVLDETPFYATSGGQKHDRGYIQQGNNKILILDVFKDKFGNHIHKVEGTIDKKIPVHCYVDPVIRLGLERNHSGTHLLFRALREVLGNEVKQLGSDNNEERLTFDLPSETKPTEEQIERVEELVRSFIAQKANREYLMMSTEQAKQMGAIMTLEENEYMDPNFVRIVEFENITADLCGGTHLSNTEKLENFKITNVEKKAAGVYRIRAISSNLLVDEFLEDQKNQLIVEVDNLIERNAKLDSNYQFNLEIPDDNEDAIKYLKNISNLIRNDYVSIMKKQENDFSFDFDNIEKEIIDNKELIYLEDIDKKTIKNIGTTLREKNINSLVIAISDDSNPMLVVSSKKYDSKYIATQIFDKFNGKGGGNSILTMGKIETKDKVKGFVIESLKWEN